MSYCTSAIASNIDLNCDSPMVPGVEVTGVIVNREDIDFTTSTITGNKVTNLVLKSGKTGYKVVQPAKDPFTGTNSALEEGTYHNTFTHQVSFVILNNTPTVASDIIDGLANGSFVVILENKSKDIAGKTGQEFQVYGWHQGLKATEITNEKYSEDTEGGWAVTLEESKAPLAAVFFFKTDYATTQTAFNSLIAE